MRIIVDIAHPAHVNFFKNALKILSQEGHEVIITGLRRGKLPRILENELGEYPIHYVGRHRGTKFSIIFEANLRKAVNLLWLLIKKRPDIGLSVGSFNLGGILKLMGKPNLQFDDDPERKVNVWLEKQTSTYLYFPPIVEVSAKVRHIKALKEWAYLTPRYFQPDEQKLEEYGLRAKQYIFVREVSTGSLNYAGQTAGLVASFAHQLPATHQVLLSLEDKSTAGAYPKDWIILEEPVQDIHSLMYFSSLIISSGDSMAREGALLGVPSVYVGFRTMKANQMMIDRQVLFHTKTEEALPLILGILNHQLKVPLQEEFRQKLLKEWDDVSTFIVKNVKELHLGNLSY